MPVSPRALAAVLALALVALALTPNLGFYTLSGMIAVLIAAALVIVTCLSRERSWQAPPAVAVAALYLPAVAGVVYLAWLSVHESSPFKAQAEVVLAAVGALLVLPACLACARTPNLLHATMIGLGVLLTGATALVPQLRFGAPENPPVSAATLQGLLVCTVLMYVAWLSFLAQPRAGLRWRGWMVRWGLLLAVGGTLRVLAVVGSPDPVIDVKSWLESAPRFLLAGENPYRAAYPSPYGTDRALRFNIRQAPEAHPASYPPGVILTGLPAAVLGFDVRYLNVAADVLAAVLILLVGLRTGFGPAGVLASGLYLSLPRAAFMTEQAWFEPQLAALAGLLTLCLPRRFGVVAAALGGLLALKQYVIVLLPVIVGTCRRRLRLVAWGLGVALVLTVPFVLWDAGAFWQMVVVAHLHRPMAYHSLMLPALLHNEFGWAVPRGLLWPVVAALLLALGRKTPAAGRGPWVLWLAASMLVFNVLIQGFPNYYYLAEFFLLLGIAQSGPLRETEGPLPAQEPS